MARRDLGVCAFLLLLVIVYFWPAMLGRIVLAPIGDASSYYLPTRIVAAKTIQDGHAPLWNPLVAGGFPLLAASENGILYPGNWLFAVLPADWAMNSLVVASYGIGALAMYAYMRRLGCVIFAAVFSALTFTFSGFLIAHLGHVSIVHSAVWLPLVLLCLDALRHERRLRFVFGGAAAFCLQILGCHPQVPVHSLLVALSYAAFFSFVAPTLRDGLAYVAIASLTLAGGAGLAATQIVPTAELALQSAHGALSYHDFISFSLPIRQLPMLLFPFLFGAGCESSLYTTLYWGRWNHTELTAYAGLAPLLLAAFVVFAASGNASARFWLLVAGTSLLLALGNATPLSKVIYEIPFLNSFRAPARHLFEFDLALAVLSGIALNTIVNDAPRRAAVYAASVIFAACIVSVAMLARLDGTNLWMPVSAQNVVGGIANDDLAHVFELANPAIFIPMIIGCLTIGGLLWLSSTRSRAARAYVIGIHIVDLCLFGQFLSWRMMAPSPAELAAPPSLASVLRSRVEDPFRARVAIVAQRSHQVDIRITPSNLARWGIASANGDDSSFMSRQSSLLGSSSGMVVEVSEGKRRRVLDALNVRYAVQVFVPPVGNRFRGIDWGALGLDARVVKGSAIHLVSHTPVPATRIGLISHLGKSEMIPDNEPVAKLIIETASHGSVERPVLAGRDTAEWAWDRADVKRSIRHRRADVIESVLSDGFEGHRYVGIIDLGARMDVTGVTIEYLEPQGELWLHKLSVVDDVTKASTPLSPSQPFDESARWAGIEKVTMPGSIGAPKGEFAIAENAQACPRAWLVPRAVSMPAAQVLSTMQSGSFPDGSAFDPCRAALVEDDPPFDAVDPEPQAEVNVVDYQPNSIRLTSRSRAPTFLVVSETFYPGWKAYVDDVRRDVIRTDYVLRGLKLPAGQHDIRFVFDSLSIKVGAALSASTLLVGLGAWGAVRRRARL